MDVANLITADPFENQLKDKFSLTRIYQKQQMIAFINHCATDLSTIVDHYSLRFAYESTVDATVVLRRGIVPEQHIRPVRLDCAVGARTELQFSKIFKNTRSKFTTPSTIPPSY